MDDTAWNVTNGSFDASRLPYQETVFTLGNGYLGTRGSFEEGYPGDVPATLIHGVYDDVPIAYTELANCPNWLPMRLFIEGERFRLDRGDILRYERRLDLRRGLLCRNVRWRSPSGHTVDLVFERFASIADQHALAVRCQVTSIDGACAIRAQAGIDGYPDNEGIAHWEWIDQGQADSTVWLHTRTRHSGIELGMAARLAIRGVNDAHLEPMPCHNCPALTTTFHADQGKTVTIEKLVTVYSSRDTDQPAPAARQHLTQLANIDNLLDDHEAAWSAIWESCDIVIEGDPLAQLAVRYSLFQVLIAVPRHDDRVSVSAKTLSGFGYRGHVFWDTEIFLLPFLTYTQPSLARNLLNYRYHTLPGARRKAQEAGYQGAMYAWESADTGDEVTPRWIPVLYEQELVRIWCGDIELHITADVAYAVWSYWQATGDDGWMQARGAEIILDTAVFWGSRVEWNALQDRYEINDVIGPDENHEHVNNSAFTNRLVRWHLEAAQETLQWLYESYPERAKSLAKQLNLTPKVLAHWRDVIARIYVVYDPQTGLIEQSEGFFALKDIDLAEYEPRSRSMQATLGIEETNRCQVLKQADVLMLLYLLRGDYRRQTLQANWDYYAPRTDHTYGSSLGPAIHAAVAAILGKPDVAYEHFTRAALVDLENVRGNTPDGVHAASHGGLWQAIVFGFGGLRLTSAGPIASPRLPQGWTRLRFRLQHRGQWYNFDLAPRPKIPDIQGVIFDLDGVLTDTSEYHYLAWQRLANEEGIPFDRQANEALRGVPRRESLLLLLDGRPVTEAEIAEMMARKNRYYQAYIQTVTHENLLPGALELLQEIKATGLQVAIGSASKNARTVLGKLGIVDWIDTISDGYSVKRHKPAPDLFLHAAAQLGLEPSQCIVVEDAKSGIEAALEGDMWTVGLGPKERVGAAHVVLPSLEGVRWHELLALLTDAQQDAEP
jgi:kojibiose phosphorylase